MQSLTFIKEIIKIANHLDTKGLYKEADKLDEIIIGFGKKAQTDYVRSRNNAIINGPEGYQEYARGHAWKKDGRLYEHLKDHSIRVYVENVPTGSADLFDTLLPNSEGMDLPFNQINTSNPYLHAVRVGYSIGDSRINNILDSTLKDAFNWDDEKINKLKDSSNTPSVSSGSIAVDNQGILLSGVKTTDGKDLSLDTQTGTLRYGDINNPGGTGYITPTDPDYIRFLEAALNSPNNVYTNTQKPIIERWLEWAKRTRQYSGSTPQGTKITDSFKGIGGSSQALGETGQAGQAAPTKSTTNIPAEYSGDTSFGIAPSNKPIKTYYKFKLKNRKEVFGYVIHYGLDGLFILDNLGARRNYALSQVNLESIKPQDESKFLKSMEPDVARRFKKEVLRIDDQP